MHECLERKPSPLLSFQQKKQNKQKRILKSSIFDSLEQCKLINQLDGPPTVNEVSKYHHITSSFRVYKQFCVVKVNNVFQALSPLWASTNKQFIPMEGICCLYSPGTQFLIRTGEEGFWRSTDYTAAYCLSTSFLVCLSVTNKTQRDRKQINNRNVLKLKRIQETPEIVIIYSLWKETHTYLQKKTICLVCLFALSPPEGK